MTNRRTFLTTAFGAGAGLGLASCAQSSRRSARAAGRRPNILIVLTDQERQDIPYSRLQLPNRDRLQRTGVTFDRAFCATPQCSASRACLLTGRYPTEAGVTANIHQGTVQGEPQGALAPDIPTFAHVLQEAGYQTGYIGKWHLSLQRPPDENGLVDYGFETYRFARLGEAASVAGDWMLDRREQPWCLMVSFVDPHDIYRISREPNYPIRDRIRIRPNTWDDLSTKPYPQTRYLLRDQGKVSVRWQERDWKRYLSLYSDLIEDLDACLGTILDGLTATGCADDTLVVYSSDHGDLGGSHGLPFKGPCMYEELLRVPMVISYPRITSRRGKSRLLVQTGDLFPTFCELTGNRVPGGVRGRSLAPHLAGSVSHWDNTIFAEYCGKQQWVVPIRTIREGDWKYNLYVDGYEELYDLAGDPGELRNLAGVERYASRKTELGTRLTVWRRSINDPTL